MTTRDKGELFLIAVAVVVCATFASRFPDRLSSGDIVLKASILLLAQGLVRDLWIKYAAPKPPDSVEPLPAHEKPARPICMCLESSVGVLGVVVGLLLLGVSATQAPLTLPRWFWPVAIGAVLSAGFLIKDLVLDWRTRSIRREKDHQNIVFW